MRYTRRQFSAGRDSGLQIRASTKSERHACASLAACSLFVILVGAASAHDGEFRIRSSTFKGGATLPISMADNFPVNGVNVCTADGSAGGNSSPELEWQNAPDGTRSFVVVAFDETASFTHWGIYNIPADATILPAGAGATGSPYGSQVNNDFGSNGYEGPCPPAGVAPDAHHYVFTVYALDKYLHLTSLGNFPQNSETVLEALATAGASGHVLGKASIGGFFSTTP